MKWRWLFILALPVLAGLLAGCSSGGKSGTTPVTVTIGSGKTSAKAAFKPSIVSKATPTVVSITFTISGPGLDTVVRTIPVVPPQTITETFYLPNGTGRIILIEARDGSNGLIYSGSTMLDLNGTPVTIALPLQNMLFNRLIWSSWDDRAKAMARDTNGNIIVVGLTYGGLEGNLNPDPSHATFDIFVAKLSPTGASIWTRQFGTAAESAYGVATDAAGNIYVTGTTKGSLNGKTLSGDTDAYVMKLDANGTERWTQLIGTTGKGTAGNAITLDAAGSAYMTGYTTGGLDGNVNAGSFDMFVMKFSTDGLWQWTAQQGTALEESGNGIALDASGTNVYVAGSTHGGLKSSPTGTEWVNRGPSTTTDMFIMMFTAASGSWQWTRQLGSSDNDDALAIAVDPARGSVYVAGGTQGSFGGTNLGLYDMFLVKFDPAGNQAWLSPQQLGSAEGDVANAVTVDAAGNVVVVGQTSGAFEGIPGDGFNDLFIVKSDPTGPTPKVLWSREFGTRADDFGVGVITSPSGTITVVGNTFGGFTSSATEDIFLLRYDSGGNVIP